MNINYVLLLSFISFSYQAYHCLSSFKACNYYNKPNVPHCVLGAVDMCMECEENYSVSNNRDSCINVPNCLYFDENGKCAQCKDYYNFDSDKNCVKDYCRIYNANGKCTYISSLLSFIATPLSSTFTISFHHLKYKL